MQNFYENKAPYIRHAQVTLQVEGDLTDQELETLRRSISVDVIVHSSDPQYAQLVSAVTVTVENDIMSGKSEEISTDLGSDGECRMRPWAKAVVSIECDLERGQEPLKEAVVALDALPDTHVFGISPLYQASNVGLPDTLNAVVSIETKLDPRKLVKAAGNVERLLSDAVDVDIVDVQGVRCDEPECMLPWPSASKRAQMLAPLLDLDPESTIGGEPVSFLLAMAPNASMVGMVSDSWVLGAAYGN